MKIVGIAGSLRSGSFNRALLRALRDEVPAGVELHIASIADIPLYDGDVERGEGIPDAVAALKDAIADSDALILASPEYNHSIPGVMKNAIDWLSRPAKDISRVFGGRPTGLVGATPGRGGTRAAQTAWLPILRALGTRPFFEESLYVDRARERFDGDPPELTDADLRERVRAYVAAFVEFVR